MLRLALLALVWVLTAGGTARAAGVLGGRIVIRDGARVIGADDLQPSGSQQIRIELRSGRQVLSARPDALGMFFVAGPPGTYRFEYLALGGVAEFFVPHDLIMGDSALTCAGTLEVTLPDATRSLGKNADSTMRVIDDCAEIAPALRQLTGWKGALRNEIARVGEPLREGRSLIDLLVGARVEAGGSLRQVDSVGGSLVYPLRGTLLSQSTWIASLSGGRLSAAPYGAVGVGYSFQVFELAAQGGYLARRSGDSGGPFGALSARLDILFMGFGGRLQYFPGSGKTSTTLILDVSPVGLLGVLL